MLFAIWAIKELYAWIAESYPSTRSRLASALKNSSENSGGALVFFARRTTYTDVEWRDALLQKLPTLDIRLAPHLGNIHDIHYALVYDPPMGFLKQFPNLKATLSIASGVDHITKDPTYPVHVPVVRMSNNYQREMMAEYALHAVLDHHRAMQIYASQQRRNVYQRVKTPYTGNTTVAVLGLGFIGAEIARKMSLMGFRVLGWSRTGKSPIPTVTALCGRHALLETILPESMYVINVLPLTPETHGLLSAEFFAAMRTGACIINLGRGGHVVDVDLVAALDSGLLSRAVLDVFSEEPLPTHHPYWTHPKVIVTPHIAGDLVPNICAENVIASMQQCEQGTLPV
eukprot:m.21930 g.21930  ORF g.21930 m.21930 type:complete len:343 (-) comp12571_c0_seq4:462-1490(-)